MSPGWTVFVAILGSLATLATAVQGIRIIVRGKRTTFTANIWKRMAELEAELTAKTQIWQTELTQERTARQRETAALRAALQQFRDRDGVWLELWHDTNVALTTNGMPAVQLPEKLRKWPEEITAVIT